MNPEFADLTLGPLLEAESFQRSGEFWESTFALSAPAPEEWIQTFDEIWDSAALTPKRHARVENHRLITICLPRELEGELIAYLQAAVERTNHAYRELKI